MSRSQKQIEPTPPMPQGATPFEEKRIACDFQLVFTRMSNSSWTSLKDSYEYAYRAGRSAGKADGLREAKEKA